MSFLARETVVSSELIAEREVSASRIFFLLGLIVGGVLGLIFGRIMSPVTPLAGTGWWILALATGLISSAYIGTRFSREPLWGLLLWGQFLAIVSVILLLFNSI